ncbi:unnamed protein product [Gadus morhua 'NCC']
MGTSLLNSSLETISRQRLSHSRKADLPRRVGRILTSSSVQPWPPPAVALTATSNYLAQLRKLWVPSPVKGAGRSMLTVPPGEYLPSMLAVGLKGSSSALHMSTT